MPVTHLPSRSVESETEPTGHVGQLLQYEREKRRLSEQDISRDLRLSVEVIRKLESGKFSELPHPVYIRGYIRAYCELLGIDSRPLLDGLELPTQEQDGSDLLDAVNEDVYRLTRLWGSLVVLSIIVILVSFWWFERGQKPNQTLPAIDASPSFDQGLESSESSPPRTEAVSPVNFDNGSQDRAGAAGTAVDIQEGFAGIVPEEPVGSDVDENPREVDEGGSGAAMEAVGETVGFTTSRSTGTPAVTDPGAVELTIRLADWSSWIEITDGEGDTLVVGMFSPGYQATVNGVFPVRFRLGDARGMRIWINGNEYDLQKHISQLNTAFFVLEEPPPP